MARVSAAQRRRAYSACSPASAFDDQVPSKKERIS